MVKKELKVKDLFANSLRHEVGLFTYLSDYKDSYPYKYLFVERVNFRHYRLFVQKYGFDFPCHDCRISANMLVSDVVNLALS